MVSEAVRLAPWEPTLVISGGARGADILGERWARENHVPVTKFPAEWRVNGIYNPSAGFERNSRMAKNAEALIAVWDGKSRGTCHMINKMRSLDKKVYVYLIPTFKRF